MAKKTERIRKKGRTITTTTKKIESMIRFIDVFPTELSSSIILARS